MIYINCEEEGCDRQADWHCTGCGRVQCNHHADLADGLGFCNKCQEKMKIIF